MHLTFGNRCGHRAPAPTLDLTRPIPVGPGGYPRILAVAAERVEAFYADPATLPSLAVGSTGSQKRSERREALIRLLKAIFKFVDLVSLTVAVRDPQAALHNITIATLANHADLELRRAERALRDLGSAGLIFIVEQRIRSSDGFRSVPAIKRVSPALFSACGLTVALKLERAKACKRLERTAAASTPLPTSPKPAAEQERVMFAVRNLTATLLQSSQTITRPRREQGDQSMERRRRWNSIALAVRQQHPDWSADEVRAAADREMLS